MNSNEIESNVKRIFEKFSKEEFPFDLLLAYGISKTSITRLKKGDFNLSKTQGEILYKKKVFFKDEATGSLLSSIDSIAKDESIIKHKPRFAIVTDFKTLVAKDLKLGKNLDIPIADLPKYYGCSSLKSFTVSFSFFFVSRCEQKPYKFSSISCIILSACS